MKIRFFDSKIFEESDLEELEKLLGAKLPLDFIDFVQQNNGSVVEPNIISLEEGEEFGVQEFIPVGEIGVARLKIEGLPSCLIPFAFVEGGDVLAFNSKDKMKIYLWSHENMHSPAKISDTFETFLDMIEALDANIDEYTLQPHEEVWVDPEFLKQFPPQFNVKKNKS